MKINKWSVFSLLCFEVGYDIVYFIALSKFALLLLT